MLLYKKDIDTYKHYFYVVITLNCWFILKIRRTGQIVYWENHLLALVTQINLQHFVLQMMYTDSLRTNSDVPNYTSIDIIRLKSLVPLVDYPILIEV